MNRFKKLWSTWCHSGLEFPYAFDPTSKSPSITLLMLYFATVVMFSAEITNLFVDITIPALVTVFVWFLAFIMYRLRKLDKVKLDLDDQSIEIESSDDQEINPDPESAQKEEKDNEQKDN